MTGYISFFLKKTHFPIGWSRQYLSSPDVCLFSSLEWTTPKQVLNIHRSRPKSFFLSPSECKPVDASAVAVKRATCLYSNVSKD